jgi:hypothetical protein
MNFQVASKYVPSPVVQRSFSMDDGINCMQSSVNFAGGTNDGINYQEISSVGSSTSRTNSTASSGSTFSATQSDSPKLVRLPIKSYPAHSQNAYAQPTGIDLQRSFQEIQELKRADNANAFQCDVDVWQDGLIPRTNPPPPPRLRFITLLFDTQCQGSNWVSAKIIETLGADVDHLPNEAEFMGFNGQLMTPSLQATLSFKNSNGGSIHRTNFLVATVENVPFDMLLGANDCIILKIIKPATLLGLAPAKQSKRAFH